MSRIFRHAAGRARLDALQTIVTQPDKDGATYYVVYQRLDVTSLVRA